ncbi:hypothetical protein SHLA_41c000660 [Shinella sp. DD12]|nr:hypothetical protein SHLA_41c000660 [Shinella sp. DD12]
MKSQISPLAHREISLSTRAVPSRDFRLLSDAQPLAQVRVFRAELFSKRLAKTLIFFFQLQEFCHLIHRRRRRDCGSSFGGFSRSAPSLRLDLSRLAHRSRRVAGFSATLLAFLNGRFHFGCFLSRCCFSDSFRAARRTRFFCYGHRRINRCHLGYICRIHFVSHNRSPSSTPSLSTARSVVSIRPWKRGSWRGSRQW